MQKLKIVLNIGDHFETNQEVIIRKQFKYIMVFANHYHSQPRYFRDDKTLLRYSGQYTGYGHTILNHSGDIIFVIYGKNNSINIGDKIATVIKS